MASLSKQEKSKLSTMNVKFSDTTMNLLKLKLYEWNLNDAIKYYNNDRFCLDYCIGRDDYKNGCSKKHCLCRHLVNLHDLIFVQQDYKQGKLLSLYLMYKKVYNDKNPELFNCYGCVLRRIGTSKQDYLKSEKYFLKSLSIDYNFDSAHSNYASLLSNKLHDFDKAEYHYNQSLTIDPKEAMTRTNFALFLINKREKYDEALSHCEKACKLEANLSYAHYMKAKSLYKLDRFDESLNEYQISLSLNENDAMLPPNDLKKARKMIILLTKKIDEEKISQVSSRRKNNTDEKTQERQLQSETMQNSNDEKGMDENMVEFNQLSIVDGIDEIMAQMIQIEQIIDDDMNDKSETNVKKQLLIVQNKLRSLRRKCNDKEKILVNHNENHDQNVVDELRSRLDKLSKEIKNGTKDSSLSLLIEINKLEQDAKAHKEKLDVCG